MGRSSLRVTIHTDGGARGNPGPAAGAFVMTAAEDGAMLKEEGIFLGHATNNVAEYSAMIAGLEAAEAAEAVEVDVFSDSQLMVRQMTGEYRVRNEGLKPLYAAARALAGRFERCDFHYLRREKNLRADALVNKTLDRSNSVRQADG